MAPCFTNGYYIENRTELVSYKYDKLNGAYK